MTAGESFRTFWARWFAPPVVQTVAVRDVARFHGAPVRVEVIVRGWGWLWLGAPGSRPKPFRGRFVREGRYPLLVPTDQLFVARCWNIFGIRSRNVHIFGNLDAPRVEVPPVALPTGPATVVVPPSWSFSFPARQTVAVAVTVPAPRVPSSPGWIRVPDLSIPVHVRIPRFEEEK